MNEPKPQQEPSMEEILASIRRIISEDDSDTDGADAAPDDPEPAAPAPVPEPEPEPEPEPVALAPAEPEGDVLDLTDEVQSDGTVVNLETGKPVVNQLDGDVELELQDPIDAAPFDDEAVISDPTAAAATSSMSSFAAAIEQATTPIPSSIPLGAGDRTIEDLVRELMRPMIREWLDANLPGMVEQLVARELERLSRNAQR